MNQIDFVRSIIQWADDSEESSICVDYEFYAQGMIQFFPNEIFFMKHSNASIPRGNLAELSEEYLRRIFYDYSSVSLHSYLDSVTKHR